MGWERRPRASLSTMLAAIPPETPQCDVPASRWQRRAAPAKFSFDFFGVTKHPVLGIYSQMGAESSIVRLIMAAVFFGGSNRDFND